jgi:hypothetical protein
MLVFFPSRGFLGSEGMIIFEVIVIGKCALHTILDGFIRLIIKLNYHFYTHKYVILPTFVVFKLLLSIYWFLTQKTSLEMFAY